MSPKQAIFFACIGEFLGACFLGTAVALTIGRGILSPEAFSLPVTSFRIILLSALASGIIWNLITWAFAMPASSSHALVGGMLGSALVSAGINGVLWNSVFIWVVIPLLLTPFIGFFFGFIAMKLSIFLLRNHRPSVSVALKKFQLVTMLFLAMSHGSNDSQKAMGIIALALVTTNSAGDFMVPVWVILACAIAITFGMSFGGWKIVKTIGTQVFKMTPLHSFDSQVASGSIIYLASIIGFPISTTQTVGSTVMGTGAGYHMSNVRWHMAQNIVKAWIITIPASAAISIIITLVLGYFI
jgi:PiT family inorganic phosphate transporter